MSSPVTKSSRFPGFWAAFFLVALRMAIGWHFLYEGMEKVHSFQTAKPFTAEPYLRNANGPLADVFRSIIPDVDSKEHLDLQKLAATWKEELTSDSAHDSLSADQKASGEKSYVAAVQKLQDWSKGKENREDLNKYLSELAKNEAVLNNPTAMSYERERSQTKRRDLESDRRKLVTAVDAIGAEVFTSLDKSLSDDQKKTGPVAKPLTQLVLINHLTAYGLTLSGASLLLGLFAPFGALGGAWLLTMFYLAMPPLPGLPDNPQAEGHYLYVNKNLIEFLACIALVFIPTSLWVGLDAVLFGPWVRARRARRESAIANS